jgi:hypothetical protein
MNPTPKRFRPRFSIRTLAILITLVCCWKTAICENSSNVPILPFRESGCFAIG